MRQKKSKKNLLIPPPTYPKSFSLPEFFWNTAQKGSSTKCFGTLRQKFRPKIVTRPSEAYNFSIPENIDTLRGSPTKLFATVRQTFFDGKSWYFHLQLFHILVRYQEYFETQHKRVPLRNVSVLWDKSFDEKPWQDPLKCKLFRYPKSVTT